MFLGSLEANMFTRRPRTVYTSLAFPHYVTSEPTSHVTVHGCSLQRRCKWDVTANVLQKMGDTVLS